MFAIEKRKCKHSFHLRIETQNREGGEEVGELREISFNIDGRTKNYTISFFFLFLR